MSARKNRLKGLSEPKKGLKEPEIRCFLENSGAFAKKMQKLTLPRILKDFRRGSYRKLCKMV